MKRVKKMKEDEDESSKEEGEKQDEEEEEKEPTQEPGTSPTDGEGDQPGEDLDVENLPRSYSTPAGTSKTSDSESDSESESMKATSFNGRPAKRITGSDPRVNNRAGIPSSSNGRTVSIIGATVGATMSATIGANLPPGNIICSGASLSSGNKIGEKVTSSTTNPGGENFLTCTPSSPHEPRPCLNITTLSVSFVFVFLSFVSVNMSSHMSLFHISRRI